MTIQSRTTLKSYFITGASPSESDFGDLIDSALLVEDIITSFDSTSTTDPLAASAGKILNDSVVDLGLRVTELEGQEQSFASSYYTKTEVDEKIAPIDTLLTQQVVANYQSQIDNLQSQIDTIDSGGTISTIAISNVTGLQAELDTKATIIQLNDVRDSLIASINAIDTSVDLSGVNDSIANIESEIDALELQIASKAEASAIPTDFYTKSEVDTKLQDIEVEDHQHVSADITDLGAEIQNKTSLLLSDHSSLQNNPHNVTKAQIGLSKVENLTPSEIVAQGEVGAISQLQSELDNHKGAQNPHNVTKDQVGLSDVPNVNFQSLLDAHIASDNPHNIDLSFFDVYAKAEADSRTQFYIDSVRYAFTPLSNNDSAGAVGDFGYDTDYVYFKAGSVNWNKLVTSPVYIEKIDENGNSTFVNEVAIENVTEIRANADFKFILDDLHNVLSFKPDGNDSYYTQLGETRINGELVIESETPTIQVAGGSLIIDAPETRVNNLQVTGGSLTEMTLIKCSTIEGDLITGVQQADISTIASSAIKIEPEPLDYTDFTDEDLDAEILRLEALI